MYLLLLATKSDHFALHAGDSSYSPYQLCLLPRSSSIVYLAFQAWTASPAGVQPDSGMDHDSECTPSIHRGLTMAANNNRDKISHPEVGGVSLLMHLWAATSQPNGCFDCKLSPWAAG
ncbi:hypothetical protein DSO57_1003377 [Entomophthora muscae]|uniref:Uncharacterized protein n=1 Tax=Entomophthora muscae TaxID=34485 RepID=A0ACC2SXM3_9FUNG|nr:hypothetical protein DSO57_1003377 [Entomophthora muscae]